MGKYFNNWVKHEFGKKHLIREVLEEAYNAGYSQAQQDIHEYTKQPYMSKKDIHTEHCCINCGCKYGDKDCTVVNKMFIQSGPCGGMYTCDPG